MHLSCILKFHGKPNAANSLWLVYIDSIYLLPSHSLKQNVLWMNGLVIPILAHLSRSSIFYRCVTAVTLDNQENWWEDEHRGLRCAQKRAGYWMWQVVEGVAWQQMQVGLTDLGGIRSRSSSSGISSKRYPSFSSWMLRSWLICCKRRKSCSCALQLQWYHDLQNSGRKFFTRNFWK